MVKKAKQTETTERQKQAKTLRSFRKWHRITASFTFVIMFLITVTGILLAWKKHAGSALQPETQRGTSAEMATWLPLDSLEILAITALKKHDMTLSAELDRIDVRPDKGVLKFSFSAHYWEVQLDGATGEVLYIGKRFSDLIEQIHDGSIIDRVFDWSGDWFKLTYSNIAGWSLLLFTITGVWLWYGPKVMRRGS